MEGTNFQFEISFSQSISKKRIQSACRLLGVKTVNRIIGIALFLLGGNRENIGNFLNLPKGTFLSLLNRFQREGIRALNDQREKRDKPGVVETIPYNNLEIVYGKHIISIPVSPNKNRLEIDSSNGLQFKTMMLSFLNSGFLSSKEAGKYLEVGERHIRDLSKNLRANDIGALLDKRRGQQKDYAFTEDVKAEIIQQFILNLITKKSTAGSQITAQVNEVCHTSLSDRAMRQHLSKLGVPKIKQSLPKLLEEAKKNSKS